MSSAEKTFIDNEINSHKVVVFSSTYCPYCTKAKNAFKNYNINDIVIHELDKRSDLDFDDAMSYLGKLTGDETVPRVFINKKFIGGGDDTERLHKNGELKKLLEDAQAL